MPVLTIEYRDESERLGLEQAIAFFRQLRQVAQTAPDGAVRAACGHAALRDGPALLRTGPAAAVQGRIEAAEQKGGPPAPVPARAGTPASPRGGTNARP